MFRVVKIQNHYFESANIWLDERKVQFEVQIIFAENKGLENEHIWKCSRFYDF